MKNQEESAMTRFILVVVAITLILVMIAVIRDKNRVKEPSTKPWINPDGSLPYETVKAIAPDYIDSLKRAGEIERWLKDHSKTLIFI